MSIYSVGDRVIDRTAEACGWVDKKGVVVEDDGSNVKVQYTSGTVRWKMDMSLKLDPQFAATASEGREEDGA